MECYFLNVLAEAQLHAVTSDWYVRRKRGFHTDPAYSLAQFLPFVLSCRVVRATARDHLCGAPREKEECTEGRVCRVSLGAGMCSPSELSDRTHSMSLTQKGERTHETRVRRTTLTTCYTDTSGNTFIHSHIHTFIHLHTFTYIHFHTFTYIQRGPSAVPHSRTLHVTHVFTCNTCLCVATCSLLVAPSGGLLALVLHASSSAVRTQGRTGEQRHTGWLHRTAVRFLRLFLGVWLLLIVRWIRTWTSPVS